MKVILGLIVVVGCQALVLPLKSKEIELGTRDDNLYTDESTQSVLEQMKYMLPF